VLWNLGVALVVHQRSGPEQRRAGTDVGEDVPEPELDDVLRIEVRAGGVVALGVDRQLLRELGHRLDVPGPLIAGGVDVRRSVLLGRVRQAGLVEQVEIDVEERGIDGERQADLALLLDVVEVDQGRVEVAEVVVVLLDVGGQVEPGSRELGPRSDAHGSHDVRSVARGDLGVEDPRRGAGVDDVEHELDLILTGVELFDDLFLGRDGGGVRAGAHADEPPDLDGAGRGAGPAEAGAGRQGGASAYGKGAGGRGGATARGRSDPHRMLLYRGGRSGRLRWGRKGWTGEVTGPPECDHSPGGATLRKPCTYL
jgi:hypothetical protein